MRSPDLSRALRRPARRSTTCRCASAAGEIVGLVGPNGAGKTTLFNAISGTVRAQRGAIRFDGARPRRAARLRARPPRHRPHVPDSATDARADGRARTSWSRSASAPAASTRAALAEILALVGLADKADADAATELSLTELKALEVAKALATQPRLLLLDEVLAGLETHGKRAFTQMLVEIHERLQLAIVVIEHDIETISTLCPRVACSISAG